ncbi:gamma-glutamyl-gamma-aminobutyrate hydrolase family protein [Candidatus Desulforudis audaxviator]|uniref:gamma-glutamyl-gamma-aminobutyrate hydrolase family protein n=1 Tax=Candidatus Desulforudis audaxviator TaxID=471827 RepID=UPI001F61ECD3|nr:gamma-glutamyl-gamma-aminobutyrate hydrolase family protein [Candidatus Desulforudis audaxviator]
MIGITCLQEHEHGQVFLPESYFRAVEQAGGVPVLLPPLSPGLGVGRMVELVDGILLAGGGDVDPVFFGEEPLPDTGIITPERDLFEIALVRRVLHAGRPVLGICRGMQVLNIAAGGDIHQDVSRAGARIKHYQEAPRWHPTHRLHVRPGSLLARILGEGALRVNSLHHQAVRRLAPGFSVSAQAGDGIIEAVEGTGPAFVLGVQFHPESMYERHPVFLNLFAALVEAAHHAWGEKPLQETAVRKQTIP